MSNHLGQRFIEPQTAELSLVFRDSSPTTPLIFVLSVGTDPAADLYKFAEEVSKLEFYAWLKVMCYINHELVQLKCVEIRSPVVLHYM